MGQAFDREDEVFFSFGMTHYFPLLYYTEKWAKSTNHPCYRCFFPNKKQGIALFKQPPVFKNYSIVFSSKIS
jgi:hypothetical protein